MALTRLLTDWVTVQGDGVTTLGATQPENEYLEVLGASDITIYALISKFSPTNSAARLNLETAPEKDTALFVAVQKVNLDDTARVGTPNVRVVKYSSGVPSVPPLARWLRWNITGEAAAWSITMRILVAINPSNYAPHLAIASEANAELASLMCRCDQIVSSGGVDR